MKIFITGGTGFLGRAVSARLVEEGHEVTILTRSPTAPRTPGAEVPGISFLRADPIEPGEWQAALNVNDVIINLAGASIFRRWTARQKKTILESRIRTTRSVVRGIEGKKTALTTLISASAVGYYGFHHDEELDERSSPGQGFLARLCREWEAEALKAEDRGIRVVLARSGIVLGGSGGALGIMLPFFRLFIGGPLGNGRQWFSWIHLQDWVGAIIFLIGRTDLSGPVNLTSPDPVRNKDLARTLGRVLHRPSLLPAPSLAVRLILGEFGNTVLKGQKVIPKRLLERRFEFRTPRLEEALKDILEKK